MRIGQDSFRGEAPRITPRALPDNSAQQAINCRLQTGDLESWRQFRLTQALVVPSGTVKTIYLLNDVFLSWTNQVDVARGVIAGDNTFRVYLTAPDIYATPQWTNYILATTGSEPYPVTTKPVGVPEPTVAPTLVLGVDDTPTTFSVDVTDAGDQLATNWITSTEAGGDGAFSAVIQDASGGNPGSCYRIQYDEINHPAQEPYAARDFGIADATVVQVTCDFKWVEDDDGQRFAGLGVQASSVGGGVLASVTNATLRIVNTDHWGFYGAPVLSSVTMSPAPAFGDWLTFDVKVTVKPDGTKTVTARVLNALAVELATTTATAKFDTGNFVGVTSASNADANPRYATIYDNIHVVASGSNGVVISKTATSYVYTFVNSIDEESPPSPVSAEALRSDGVSVTVTTPTSSPDNPAYDITTKRIYRAVSGATGDVFEFVAEIALATADYVDVLNDDEIGPDILESTEWDLPPDDLQGIIALPNGIMAGFRRNQLCLSEKGRPHAWPVRYRLPADTDIVAICNIDNTVVIGTKSFVYTASGNDPATYSMSKPGEAQACVAKLGMVYLDGVGVVFPSPDGWQACSGSAGAVRCISEGIFTKRQWEALKPESIVAAVHDSVLHWWYNTEFVPAKAPGEEGVIALFHFTNAEFNGAQTAVDQTGATWTADNINWLLPASSPAPKFGTGYLSGPQEAQGATWTRDATQASPSIPDTYARHDNNSMAWDAWFYVQSGGSNGNAFCRINSMGVIALGIDVGQFTITGTVNGSALSLDGGVPPADQWFHVRLNYDGTTARLTVNGVVIDSDAIDLSGVVLLDVVEITAAQGLSTHPVNLEEAYLILDDSLSTGNFTPPIAEWSL